MLRGSRSWSPQSHRRTSDPHRESNHGSLSVNSAVESLDPLNCRHSQCISMSLFWGVSIIPPRDEDVEEDTETAGIHKTQGAVRLIWPLLLVEDYNFENGRNRANMQ